MCSLTQDVGAISPVCFDKSKIRDHFCQPPWGGPKAKSGLGIALTSTKKELASRVLTYARRRRYISAMLWQIQNPRPLLPTAMGGSEGKKWSRNRSNVNLKGIGFACAHLGKTIFVMLWDTANQRPLWMTKLSPTLEAGQSVLSQQGYKEFFPANFQSNVCGTLCTFWFGRGKCPPILEACPYNLFPWSPWIHSHEVLCYFQFDMFDLGEQCLS